MLRILACACLTAAITSACEAPRDDEEDDDALGCGLPEPCEAVSLPEDSLELEPRAAAECMYDVLVSGEAAHLTMEFITTSETHWDLYVRPGEPPVLTAKHCELEGPCGALEAWRCQLETADGLDCANGSEPSRVCESMIEWCTVRTPIEPGCP